MQLLPEWMHSCLTEAFKYRQIGDYCPVGAILHWFINCEAIKYINKNEAEKLKDSAQNFIDKIKEYL